MQAANKAEVVQYGNGEIRRAFGSMPEAAAGPDWFGDGYSLTAISVAIERTIAALP